MIKKMNWEKGLIRLYVLWSLGCLIYIGYCIPRFGLYVGSYIVVYYESEVVRFSEIMRLPIAKALILFIAPWVLHLPLKWAIRGFKGGPEETK